MSTQDKFRSRAGDVLVATAAVVTGFVSYWCAVHKVETSTFQSGTHFLMFLVLNTPKEIWSADERSQADDENTSKMMNRKTKRRKKK